MIGGAHVRSSVAEGVVVVHRIDIVHDTRSVGFHEVDKLGILLREFVQTFVEPIDLGTHREWKDDRVPAVPPCFAPPTRGDAAFGSATNH